VAGVAARLAARILLAFPPRGVNGGPLLGTAYLLIYIGLWVRDQPWARPRRFWRAITRDAGSRLMAAITPQQ
jgi:hypothetical protein